jgi:hypothetical protein
MRWDRYLPSCSEEDYLLCFRLSCCIVFSAVERVGYGFRKRWQALSHWSMVVKNSLNCKYL